jgi:hypothetical protein
MTNQRTNRWGRLGSGLVMLGVVGLGGALAGCGGGGAPPPATCDDGTISTTWSLQQNGSPVDCATGDNVTITVDDTMSMTYDCLSHGATTPSVQGGVNHAIAFDLRDAGGNLLSSTNDMSIFVPCGTVAQTPDVTFIVQ